MTIATGYSWVETIDNELFNLDEQPQFGTAPPFPLEALESHLQKLFGKSDLKLFFKEGGWQEGEALFEGIPFKCYASPLSSPLYCMMREGDVNTLMEKLLGEESSATPLIDPAYLEGFMQFFAVSFLNCLNQLNYASGLAFRLDKVSSELPLKEPVFVIGMALEVGGGVVAGRLLLTSAFRKEWKSYFYGVKPSFSKKRAAKVPVTVTLVGGKTQLSASEWKEVQVGDVVLLDHSSLDIEKRKGKVLVLWNDRILFRGKLLEGGIKLLEYPLYEEVSMAMDDNLEEEENLYEEEEEEDLPPVLFEEKSEEEASVKKEPSLEDVPIQLTVEVGRVGMSLEALMQLAPGNVIDMKVEPERGVDLTVNGKKVGKGELVKIGDVLGVRITEL